MGVSLAAAATSTVSCKAQLLSITTADCESCVAVGGSSVCANFTAAVRPVCTTGLCATAACPSTYTGKWDACGVCVNALNLLPVCIATTEVIGYALKSSIDFGASFDLNAAFDAQSVFAEVNSTVTAAITAASSVVQVVGSNIAAIAVGASTAASVAIFEIKSAANTAVAIANWTNNAAAAKVENSAKLTIAALQTGGSYFSVWQNASVSAAAAVTFNNIDFSTRAQFSGNGVVHVAGGSASVNASGVKFSSGTSGTLKLTGGATIAVTEGSLPQALTIDISAQGQSSPLAIVEGSLSTAGEITGSASGVLVVNGQLTLGATTTKVQPQVVVKANGKVTVNSSAAGFVATDVRVGAAAALELGQSTYELAKSGALVFNNLWVDAQGQVKIYQSAAARTASLAGQAVVAFNYSASANVAALAQATVSIITSTGASVKLSSTTTVAAGRRLLADSNTATWGPNGMSYTYDGSTNGAAQVLALPVMLIGLLGLFL